jgi:hypothetical protein
VDAEKVSRRAVRTLEKGDEQSLLAEALTTHGISLARLGHPEQAHSALERAIDRAQKAGDLEGAGNTVLAMIEERGCYLSIDDLYATVTCAKMLLEKTRDMPSVWRLANCVCSVLSLIHSSGWFPASVDWTNFSLEPEVLRYEAQFHQTGTQRVRWQSYSGDRTARPVWSPTLAVHSQQPAQRSAF